MKKAASKELDKMKKTIEMVASKGGKKLSRSSSTQAPQSNEVDVDQHFGSAGSY